MVAKRSLVEAFGNRVDVDEGIALEDDLELLDGLGDDVPDVNLNTDDVLVARKMSNNRVRYYTREEFSKKYGDTKKLRDQVLLIKGQDGIRRTLPQVYYSAAIPDGTSPKDAHALRREHFISEMKRLDMDYIRPDFPRKTYRALKPNDPQARYDTPGGKRTRRHIYQNETVAGAQLPDVMYRHKGRLIGTYATLDATLKGKDFKDLRKMPGFEMKSSNHSFAAPDSLDKLYGHGTAAGRYDGYHNRRTRPNKSLPEVIVKVGNKYVSADLMQQKKSTSSAARALGGDPRHLKRLKALVLNEAGTSYMHPATLKRLDPDHYNKVAQAHKLPDGFASIKRDYRLGRIMLQASQNVFRSGNDPEIQTYRGAFKEAYSDTRVFVQGNNKYDKATGIMGMLRTYERGDKTIPQAVAKDLGIDPKMSTRDRRKQDQQKKYDMVTDAGISEIDSNAGDAAAQNRRTMAKQTRPRDRGSNASMDFG